MLRQRGRVGLMTAALVGLIAGVAGASERTSTEESRSILVWPKVLATEERDTIIQITNTSNLPAFAHCFYVNGALRYPCIEGSCDLTGEECESDNDCAGPDNPPLWQEIDFDIQLTAKQPTHWVVSKGRLDDPFDPPCENYGGKRECSGGDCPGEPDGRSYGAKCDGAGIDPGRVPPVPEGFTGELKCIEVDGMAPGAPFPGDDLKGNATIITRLPYEDPPDPNGPVGGNKGGPIDVSKYNAIGFKGLNPPSLETPDLTNLCLGTSDDPDFCPSGPEYSGCPEFWVISHPGEGMVTPAYEVSVSTDLTIVPCTQNFETQDPESVTLFIESWDEFEVSLSAFVQVTCWRDVSLSDIDPFAFAGPTFRQTRMRPSSQTRSGVVMVAEERYYEVENDSGTGTTSPNNNENGDFVVRAAYNPHMEGERALDVITVPGDQLVPPPTF